MTNALKLILVVGLSFSCISKADKTAEYKVKVDQVQSELQKYDKSYFKFLERHEVQETVESYRKALGLIEEIANDATIADAAKSELLLTIADSCGALFTRLTEPFADVAKEPLTWTELSQDSRREGIQGWFLQAGRFSWDRIAWHGESLLRDFLRVWPLHYDEGSLKLHWPFALPFGSDWNRSTAARDTVKDTAIFLRTELEKGVAGDLNNSGLSAVKTLMAHLEKAEPIRWAASNNRFRLFLLVLLAPYVATKPPIDFWWFTIDGPTQYSLLVSSVFETAAVLFAGKIRRNDSALDAYWNFDRALREATGRPSTRWQKFVVWTRLSKMPGLEFLGKGLEKSKAYAAVYQSCPTALAAHGGDGEEVIEKALGVPKPRGRRRQ